MKICNICNIEKPLNDFTNVKSKGKIKKRPTCKKCTSLRVKNWVIANPEKRKSYVKQYSLINKNSINDKSKSYYQQNKINILNKKRNQDRLNQKILLLKNCLEDYKQRNPTAPDDYQLTNNDIRNYKYRLKLKTDNLFKLKVNLRTLIRNSFKRKGINKVLKSEQILGCSMNDFKQHLESQFESWMNWNNYGLYNGQPNYGWDIDHIQPLNTATCDADIIRLNHYTNLRPLCSYYNRIIRNQTQI